MLRSGIIVLASLGLGASAWGASGVTAPVDATQRNPQFAPGPNLSPAVKTPPRAASWQERRVGKTVVAKQATVPAARPAPVELTEARTKTVLENVVRRPGVVDVPRSAFDRRVAAISTRGDTNRPPLVRKYQDGLAAASAGNRARFPALAGATAAVVNRFVFRKNPSDSVAATEGISPVPAAGGPSVGN